MSTTATSSASSSAMLTIGPRTPLEEQKIFYEVSGKVNGEKMAAVSDIFKRILTPLYGSQDKAIQQIQESKDRRCYLLYDQEIPTGVLVFKTVLSNEFAEFGIKDSIEIKSLFLDNSNEKSGKGIGSLLVTKVIEEAERLNIGHTGIHVTVSENKTDSLAFFQKKGFTIAHAWKDRYKPGVTEFLLSCPRIIKTQGQDAVVALAASLQTSFLSADRNASLIQVVHTHEGDIHILMPLSDGHFISGAKDNCIYKWNENGALIYNVDDVEPVYQSERNWITAAERINKQYWVTGKRNGDINLWRTSGEHVRRIKLNFPKKPSSYTHIFNDNRVMSIARGLDRENPTIFVGIPTEFEEYSLVEGKSVSSTVVDKHDWPYCISPLTESSLLIVIAGRIEEWRKTQEKWNFSSIIVSEGKKVRGEGSKPQRPFISSLKPLASHSNHYVFTDFIGAVKLLDLNHNKIVRQWKEHEKRVWTNEPLADGTIASCGEDCLIKIWDIRQDKSVRTISEPGNVRQVNALLNLKENLLIAGTSTDNGSTGSDKRAQLRFYDLRKAG